MLDDKSHQVLRRAERLEDTFRVLAEFGVFGPERYHLQLLDSITNARLMAAEGRLVEALDMTTRGELMLNQVLFSRGRLWRCIFLHQLPLFAYHLLFLLVLLNIATGWLRFFSSQLWSSVPVPVGVAVAGGLGAVLRGLWFLWLKVSRREFRIHFALAQLAAPWIGILLGIFAFLLLKAGLLLVEGAKPSSSGASAFELAVCFFAGYRWERLLEWVDSIKLRTEGSRPSGTLEAPNPSAPPDANRAPHGSRR